MIDDPLTLGSSAAGLLLLFVSVVCGRMKLAAEGKMDFIACGSSGDGGFALLMKPS